MSDESSSATQAQKSKHEVLDRQIEIGVEEMNSDSSSLFLSGLSAGLDIGFGPLFMGVVLTLVGGIWGHALTEFAVATMYAVGFVFVVIGGTELFTEHTTLAVLPVLADRARLTDLARLWGLVYAGNIAGGTAFAALIAFVLPRYGIVDPTTMVSISHHYVAAGVPVLFVGAVLAGWLMGLLSWLVTASQSTTARILVVVIVTSVIGLGHLPHSIAGNVEMVAATLVSAKIGLADYLRFLVVATTGNVVGGSVFVALLRYGYTVEWE